MSSASTTTRNLDPALLEAAASWRVWLSADEREPDPAVSEAFHRWLAADPRHAEAFDRTTAAWTLFEPHGAAPEVIRARRDALDFARRSGRQRWGHNPSRRMSLRIAASVAMAAVLGVAAWPVFDGVDVYKTGVGQRRLLTLADGSTVAMDSASKLTVRYSDDARRLALESGQARFDVAHNPYRPFSVRAGDRTVVATGTAFNIDILKNDVQVTLIEGSVIVAPVAQDRRQPQGAEPLAQPVALKSGQRLMVATGSPRTVVEAVKLEDATAWQWGKLIFNDVPLEKAVMRVNRYSDRKIVIHDPTVADLQVSGIFQAGDSAAFARTMSEYLGLQASFAEGDEIVLEAPAKG